MFSPVIRPLFGAISLLPLLLLFCAATSSAQPDDYPPAIHVVGIASADGQPDQVRLAIGVTTESKEAAEAARENAKKLADVLDALRKHMPKATIETINYSLEPVYLTSRGEGEPTITSYRAMNTVRLETEAVDKVGSVIDVAMEAGATNIYNLSFRISDDDELRTEALRKATAKARREAETVVQALGLTIKRVLSVEASGWNRADEMEARRSYYEGASTPIDVSNIAVYARVELVVEIGE